MALVPKPTHRKPLGLDKERQDRAGTRNATGGGQRDRVHREQKEDVAADTRKPAAEKSSASPPGQVERGMRRVDRDAVRKNEQAKRGPVRDAASEEALARTRATAEAEVAATGREDRSGGPKGSARRQPSEAFLKAHGRDSETMAARRAPAAQPEQVGEFSSPEHFKRVYNKETGSWSLVYTPPAPQRPQISPRGLKSFPMSPEMAEELQRIKPPTPPAVISLPPAYHSQARPHARASRVGETSSQVAPIGAVALPERWVGKRLFRESGADDDRGVRGGVRSAPAAPAAPGRGAARGHNVAAERSRAGAAVCGGEEAAGAGLGGTAAAEELQLRLYLAQEEMAGDVHEEMAGDVSESAAEFSDAPAGMMPQGRGVHVQGRLRADDGSSALRSLVSNRSGGYVDVALEDEALAVALAAEVRAEAEAMVAQMDRGSLTQNASLLSHNGPTRNEPANGRGLLIQSALQSASQTGQARSSGLAPPAHQRSIPTAVGTQRSAEVAVGSVPASALPTAVGTQRSPEAAVGSTQASVGAHRPQHNLGSAPGVHRTQSERDSVRALLRGGVGSGHAPGQVHTQRRMRRGEFELEGATYEQLLMLDEGLTGLGKGLKKDKIDKVKRMATALRSKEGRPEADCCICLETVERGAEGWTLMCRHHFHEACIVPWLSKNAQCPHCRAEMTRV